MGAREKGMNLLNTSLCLREITSKVENSDCAPRHVPLDQGSDFEYMCTGAACLDQVNHGACSVILETDSDEAVRRYALPIYSYKAQCN